MLCNFHSLEKMILRTSVVISFMKERISEVLTLLLLLIRVTLGLRVCRFLLHAQGAQGDLRVEDFQVNQPISPFCFFRVPSLSLFLFIP